MKKIPNAVGPYSPFRLAGDYLYISGQLGINPLTNKLEEKTVVEQTRQALENLKSILENNGLNMSNIVKTTVLLDNIEDFSEVNRVYGEFFNKPYPARSAFEVGKLPLNALVEIEAIAYVK